MKYFAGLLMCFLILGGVMESQAEEKSSREYPDELIVALLQMEPHGNDQQANFDKAEEFCRRAADMGADIALMPEMWNIGYTRFDDSVPNIRQEFYTWAVSKHSEEIQRFARLADELDMAIGVTYMQAYDPLPRNAITLFDRYGKEVYSYAKVHTSDFKSMECSMTPGDDFYVGELDTRLGPVMVGSMICFDREQPESARILMLKGAELILTPNACRLDDNRIDQFKVRAFENLCGVAMTNYPHGKYKGRSVAFDSEGDCLVEAPAEEGVFLAAFDLEDMRERRRSKIWGNAYRRPHKYDILTSPEKDEVWSRIDGNGNPYDASVR